MTADRRVKKDQLKEILEYIFDNANGKGKPLADVGEKEKKAAIDKVLEEFMEPRRDAPLAPEDLTYKLALQFAEDLLNKLTKDNKEIPDVSISKEDIELLKKFKDPKFEPTPEQTKRYKELQEQFEEVCKQMKKVFKLEKSVPELVKDAMDAAELTYINLYGSRPNGSIPIPQAVNHGHIGIAITRPAAEYSGALIDKDNQTSDTLTGESNLKTWARLAEIGDSDACEYFKKEVLSTVPKPRPT